MWVVDGGEQKRREIGTKGKYNKGSFHLARRSMHIIQGAIGKTGREQVV